MRHLLILLILVLLGCNQAPSTNPAATEQLTENPQDDHSYANLEQINTTHLHLDLEVDFAAQTIYGIARHRMRNNGADTAIFDIKGLLIQKITLGPKNKERETDFTIGPMDKDSIFGQALLVNVDSTTQYVNIYYQTTEASAALDWLDTTLTSSKTKPFLYTQGQAILTRTWIPIQDSPSNRLTYSADVKVPSDLLALMSAKNPTQLQKNGLYHFEMPRAIPSYLIALAVGDIAFKDLGHNCGVYAEKELVDNCANEFEDLPEMMRVAEALYGPYKWGRYDVLVLPYSFPFGGMENPMLTFANPTLLTGDKSLVSVLAHELAHSWSGNLVTNHSWSDLWLNEGTTVYFEERIMEALKGKEVADILAQVEFRELEQTIAEMRQDSSYEDSKLHLNLVNRDPDIAMSDVAYVKGAFFFRTLEQTVGRKKLDAFLKQYFSHFAFQTISADEFIDYLESELLAKSGKDFNYRAWIFQPGLPSNCVHIAAPRIEKIESQAQLFNQGKNPFKAKVSYKWVRKNGKRKRIKTLVQTKYQDLLIQEWQLFIGALSNPPAYRLQELDKQFAFSESGNSEILCNWFVLAAKSDYAFQIEPKITAFLGKVGRRKYVLPIYEALASSPKGLQVAKRIFHQSKSNYHSVTRGSVWKMLQKKG
ncbi:MAG: M1 family metallopeptidase [Sphingomonadales bacterium]